MKENTNLTLLSEMLLEENYETIQIELLQKSPEIYKLGLFYVNAIIKRKSLIKSLINDNIIPYPKEVNDEFIHEYYCELSAYEDCLFECIQIIELKNTLLDCLAEIEDKLDSYEDELYPGFLTSEESILEVSTMYSTLKKFKVEIEKLLTKKPIQIYN